MALPGDIPSSVPVIADYISPYDRYTGWLEDFEDGGIALNDGTQGLEIQTWYLSYNDNEIHPNYGDFTVTPESVGAPTVVLNVPGVTRCGLAFNQNMDVFIAYEGNTCGAQFYWWDPNIAGYTTTSLPAGSRYVACCLDDHRITQTGTSDIILGYIRAGTLYYRQQRERFTVERSLGVVGGGILHKVGMTENLRLKFDVREGPSTRLSDIVGDLCGFVGMPGNKIDVADLYPVFVRGFIVANAATVADTIRTLQATHFFDMPEVDGKLVAVPRGGDIAVAINLADCVVGHEVNIETAREQGVEFPRKVHLMYTSAESDYTPTKETSERRSPDIKAQSEFEIDTAVNFTSDEAAQRADIIHKIAWNEFEGTAKFGIPEDFAAYVPSDLVSLEVRSGVFKRLRIQKMIFVDGYFDSEAVVDRRSSYTSGAVGLITITPEPPPPTLSGDTTWEFMDLPALITTHDTLRYYVAGHGDVATAWHGAQLQRLVGANYLKEADILAAETMGLVEETLPFAPAEYIDITNTILVSLNNPPESTTTELMLAGQGAWLIGDEIIQVRDWVAESTNWRGSYLIRGRLDTPATSHGVGQRVVFLGNPVSVPADVALRDTSLTLRAPSYGQVGSDATSAPYTFIGRSQEEWPPESLIATQVGNDWELSWTPRYRLGSSVAPIPSANFYGWALRFTIGATTVYRESSGGTTPSFTYTEAQQVADWGSAQSSFDDVEIRGLNYLGGEGKPLNEAVS